MSDPSDTIPSAFHHGEHAMQTRLGVRDQLEQLGARLMRDHMPDQHRELFAKLPMVLLGSMDDKGQPWASVLTRAQGLMTSSSAQQLDIHTLPLANDPLAHNLKPGAPVGMLGIEPHTRRRNRMNGRVAAIDKQGFSISVQQSFGNCPKYIQARSPLMSSDTTAQLPQPADAELTTEVAIAPTAALAATSSPIRSDTLTPAMQAIIARADTYFIASAAGRELDPSNPSQGVDISHRGGKPGFVLVNDSRTLTAPDFIGNFFFNTLGNLTVYPKAGLLFIDFDTGDLLYLATTAEILFDPEQAQAYTGAQRLLRFAIEQAILLPQAMLLRWSAPQLSPVLAATGSWQSNERPSESTSDGISESTTAGEPAQ